MSASRETGRRDRAESTPSSDEYSEAQTRFLEQQAEALARFLQSQSDAETRLEIEMTRLVEKQRDHLTRWTRARTVMPDTRYEL
jgi:hypothetical protein